jgi:hypothetical protein
MVAASHRVCAYIQVIAVLLTNRDRLIFRDASAMGGSCVVLSTAENFGFGKWQVESGYFGSLLPAASTTALSSSSVHYLLIPIIILSQEAR